MCKTDALPAELTAHIVDLAAIYGTELYHVILPAVHMVSITRQRNGRTVFARQDSPHGAVNNAVGVENFSRPSSGVRHDRCYRQTVGYVGDRRRAPLPCTQQLEDGASGTQA